jgi:hypothetical protein
MQPFANGGSTLHHAKRKAGRQPGFSKLNLTRKSTMLASVPFDQLSLLDSDEIPYFPFLRTQGIAKTTEGALLGSFVLWRISKGKYRTAPIFLSDKEITEGTGLTDEELAKAKEDILATLDRPAVGCAFLHDPKAEKGWWAVIDWVDAG